ncbi:MAG TPA: RnfABCDGE type electron transport complex subunit D [Candidatus Limnocylindrales bacterium]|nr:RnfABCDGE type electron transport complex subunit D [Candidatus Limnocylindrales bacterium]
MRYPTMPTTDAPSSRGLSSAAEQPRRPGAPRRTVRIRGRRYPVLLPSIRDPRLHVAAVLLTLQVLGQTVLDFRLSIAQILICLAAGALIEFGVGFFKDKVIMWPASGLLTGNSTAFILRVPGTFHGQWWSTHGIWIFIGVVAVSMASKYLIRWRGGHIFNPSNLGLVLAFVLLGPQYTEPQDLWWIPMGPWMIVTYAILIGGGLLIARELKLLGLELGYMVAFAAFTALALLPVPDHCMIASWYATPLCGPQLWQILVTSPEVLIFALFMVPDPRTVPDSQLGRFVFGVIVAFLSVALIGPTTLEFWTKTAILASLVFACAGRFALVRLLTPLEDAGGLGEVLRTLGWRTPALAGASLILLAALPLTSELSLHAVQPAPELPDGSQPKVALTVGSGPDLGAWTFSAAGAALPPPGNAASGTRSGRVWVLPPIPTPSIASNVMAFDPKMNQATANQLAHDAVLDLMIESEARRAHDVKLAADGATGDGLTEFTDVINQDVAAGKTIQKIYSFDRIDLTLFLPKFSTQASRLVGVELHGTTTLIARDASGNVLSQQTLSYDKSWGLAAGGDGTHQVIVNDYTDNTRA